MRKTLGDILLFFCSPRSPWWALLRCSASGGGNQRTSTIERVLQPEAAVQLEAQQLAAEDAQAQRDAARRAARLAALWRRTHAGGHGRARADCVAAPRRPVVVQHQLPPPNTPPHLIDAQWRVIDAQMLGSGYELEDGRRGK